MIEFVTGSLLDSKEKFIVHQANCVSHYASGIAAAIFSKFPYSDIYTSRMESDKPGTIIVKGNGLDQRYVVNLMGQFYPGSFSDDEIDNEKARQVYFHHALIRLAKTPNLESIAFNYKIGCGIAGGDWNGYYLGTLENFADYVWKNQGAKTFIYQREEDK